ncbi:MAG: hypothetical protein JNM28_07170 [Armatimonadetes bacterium]|nr:hypothetical protein [Armatimonadota bacterium]
MGLTETISRLASGSLSFPTSDQAIRITGRDAISWLQGQVTQDLAKLADGPVSACLCLPTGQLQTLLRIAETGDGLLVITPHPELLLQRIEDFVIVEDVAGINLGPVSSTQGVGSTGLAFHDRSGFGGYDSIEGDGTPEIPDEQIHALEIAAGIPRLGLDTSAKTLPPELGPAFEAEYVSYTKGCYVGQEVLHRIHARGHVNRQWVALVSDSTIPCGEIPGAGVIHRSAPHPNYGFIASATLRSESAEPGTKIAIAGTAAVVDEMPLFRRG